MRAAKGSDLKYKACKKGLCILFSILTAAIVTSIALYLISIYDINRSYYEEYSTKGEIALRKFPYPYRAAMAICSDIDGTTTKEEFLEIQKLLNTKEQTSMGEGIGLEIGNTFMMYAEPTCAISYFSKNPESAKVIKRFIETGYIDCIHSYGEKEDFTRKDAIRAIEELNKNRLKVDVWVDHDTTRDNLGDDCTFGLGDHRGSVVYHSDLTIAYGIKFAWLGRLTMVTGQSAPITFRSFTGIYNPDHPIPSLVSMTKEFAKNVLAVFGNRKYAMHKTYELIRIKRLDDGQEIYEFMRFDNYWKGVATGATAKGLAYVISRQTLDRLKEVGGYAIVYTHLGKNSDCSQWIPEETLGALRNLEREYRAGNIYVTTTSRLLNYYVNHKYLKWSYETRGDEIVIKVSRVEEPILGSFVPTVQDVNGITFYVPHKDRVRIYVGDREIGDIRRNPPDYTGRESITIL